ncbi:MAG: glucose PTS transporter subunit IIA [Coriobacteriaceae bacterium]|nr:glucose PTS transporter subunit IIA [Coriobacteriaceae bacterium]
MAVFPTAPHADELVYAPVDGTVLEIRDVDEPLFALELLGRSCAIEPSSPMIVSPIAGTVTTFADTLHAIGITSPCGAELLVHMGIGTAALGGGPFSPRIALGDRVEKGEVLTGMDLGMIEAAGIRTTVITIVANSDEYGCVELLGAGSVRAGDKLMRLSV